MWTDPRACPKIHEVQHRANNNQREQQRSPKFLGTSTTCRLGAESCGPEARGSSRGLRRALEMSGEPPPRK
eukprot:521521-Alexandrium_andersonii.AAC.1